MEGNGGKRRSGSHGEKADCDRVGNSAAENKKVLKRRCRGIGREGAAAKRLRSGNDGAKDILENGSKSLARRGRRRSNVSMSGRNAAEVECVKRPGNSDVSFDEGDRERNRLVTDASELADTSCLASEVPELCSCLEGGVVVPKRPRGASRRKKSERLLMPRRASAGLSDFLSTIEANSLDEKVHEDPVSLTCASDSKKKKDVGEPKKDSMGRSGKRVSSVVDLLLVKVEEPDDKINEESQQKKRKRRTPNVENGSQIDNETNLVRECENSDQRLDEEENLEHNAAKMLSSRFDTSGSVSHPEKPSSGPSNSRRRNSAAPSSAVDATVRLLRPRRQDFQGFVKKRRHFYEVHATDMDSHWLIDKKIKIFCPLDHGWSFGIVKDYNPDTSMHLIKYEGRDEEWADLRKERIKLLLFHSELYGSSQRTNSEVKGALDDKLQPSEGDSSVNSLLDSEPIISYYTRLTQRVKKSSLKATRKIGRSRHDKFSKPSGGRPRLKAKMLPSSCNVSEVANLEISKFPVPISQNILSDRRFSFMYSRKRFCKLKRESENTIKESCRSFGYLISERGFKFNIASKLARLQRGELKLLLHPLCLLFLVEGHPYYRELLLSRDYAMVLLRPVVHMEIIFVGSAAGWSFISFEGCLGHLVSVLFLIMGISQCTIDYTDCLKMQMPFALISLRPSGTRDTGRHPVFMFISLDKKCRKSAYLEGQLDCFRSLITSRVSSFDCNIESFKRCLDDTDLMPYISRVIPHQDTLDRILQAENVSEKLIPSSCALSSAVESSLSLCQYLKLPTENKECHDNLQNCSSVAARVLHGNNGKATEGSCSPADDSSDQVSEITLENTGSSQSHTPEVPSHVLSKVEADTLSLSSDDDWKRTQDFAKSVPGTAENSVLHSLRNVNSKNLRSQRQPRRSWRAAWNSYSQFADDISSPDKSDNGTHNYSEVIHASKRTCREENDANLSKFDPQWKVQDPDLHSPGSKGFCIIQHPVSPDFSCFSENYCAESPKIDCANQYRKPRTLVRYSLPHIRYDSCSRSRSHKRKGYPTKKVKSDRSKYSRTVTKSSRSYSKSFSCEANVLVTDIDRGWRECAAEVVLESEGQSWKLMVHISGNVRYSYKADQFIQPGTTNRYTHAMIWKGGSNWALEFTDRNQWAAFKEMHEECYNRNIRAASVKNIPIPGVRLIEDNSDYITTAPFDRSSHYFRQDGNEVDLALHPDHVVYDMDSDDENFISRLGNFGNGNENKQWEISDELFEKAMDMLEKFSYSEKSDEWPETEIESLLADIGSSSMIHSIYGHWRAKRKRKGVALVRQFQPALWEQYQMKLKEWEESVNQTTHSSVVQQEKKPPMFAFCLKPRRLKVPNKSSSQRPHKKFTRQSSHQKEQDRTRASGRKPNKLSCENDEVSVSVANQSKFHRQSILPWSGYSSPCAANKTEAKKVDRSERIQHLTLHGSNPKKMGIVQSIRDHRMTEMVYEQRTNNRSCTWNSGLPECSSPRQIDSERIETSPAEIEEFRLRDASDAAQHALNMAKLKREKAEWLLRKADLAAHKATVALITAEAIKASEEDLIGDG